MKQAAIIVGLLLCCLAPAGGQRVEDLGLSQEQMEDKLIGLVNSERRSHGLPELRFDPQLRDLARAHCLKMIAENSLGHDFPGYEKIKERTAGAGLYFSKIGENVARSDTFVIRLFHEALLASPEHRENIVDREFTHLGVGIERRGAMHYVTQEFGRLFEPRPVEEVESALAGELKTCFAPSFALPPDASGEMLELCRRMSLRFLQGQAPPEVPASFGSALVFNLDFSEWEDGRKRLLDQARAHKPLYWSLGVAFGRSPRNPGGIYALSLLMLPDLREGLQGAAGLDEHLFRVLGRIRTMPWNSRFARPAAEIARRYYRFPSRPPVIPGRKNRYRLILVYQTFSLDSVPDDIARRITSVREIRGASGHVLYPLAEGLPGNYFIVAILCA